MGCTGSRAKGDDNIKKIRKPKPWKHSESITKTQLIKMRDEFWDTAPHYGGQKEIWDALHAAAEADLSLAQAIVESAGVILQSEDLTICYDERGVKHKGYTSVQCVKLVNICLYKNEHGPGFLQLISVLLQVLSMNFPSTS